MKLSTALNILVDLRLAIFAGLLPTLKCLWHTPALIFSPITISRLFMSFVWAAFANGIDENSRTIKDDLITPNARGVVLDIGSGFGHTVNYLGPEVTKFIALEPNPAMHAEIRKRANAKGFTESDNSLLIISCGTEDTALILSAIGQPNSVDTIVSILTLCTVESPEQSLTSLVRYFLKPGGTFVFYEHVLSHRHDVAWWQRFWTPIWMLAFDGCRLDRPTHLWIERMDDWKIKELKGKAGEPEEHLFWHQIGKFVKA